MTDELILEKAAVLCYRLFDIAEEIDLDRAHALLASTERLRLMRAGSEYLQLPNPPLTVTLAPCELRLRSGSCTVQAAARFFAHGAASIILEVPVNAGTSLASLTPLADELYDSPTVEALCAQLMNGMRDAIAGALTDSHLWEQSESYTVIFVERMTGAPCADVLLARAELPHLLLGETLGQLSQRERRDVLEHHFSYTERDLVVVDWNAAFVYEPSGSRDVPDLLEIANAQLLEFRYFDHVLEGELQTVYRAIASTRGGALRLVNSPYRKLARRVMVTLIEISEFIERVENSLKIVGDFYLAKVYEGALLQLRVRAWQSSVTRKQGLLAQAYGLLKGEVETDRALLLESMIVLLIVAEILMALIGGLI